MAKHTEPEGFSMTEEDVFFDDDLLDLDEIGDETVDEQETARSKGLKSTFGRVVGEARARLSRSDGSGDHLIPEARLASVVSESTPGPAFELLRLNEPFALPGLNAYVLLVLPTSGEFGGLSRRSKDEARGTIINLISADNIHAIVTPELLDDDALGIVPDEESLSRMEEFELLRDARYLYGVACEDIETGEVKVFSVPPILEETAVQGRLFEQACEISRGELDLASVLDVSLIAAMLTIYRSADDAISGTAALTRAEELNMECVVKAVSQDRYPTATELIANLSTEFPVVGESAATSESTPEPDPVTSEVEDDERAPVDVEEAAALLEETPIPEFVDDDRLEMEFHDDALPDTADDTDPAAEYEPDFGAEPEAGSDNSAEPEWDEPDFGHETQEAGGTEATAPVMEQIEALRSDIVALVKGIQGAAAPAGMSTPAAVPVTSGTERSNDITIEPGSEFSYDQALEAAGRVYTNDELGLVVDAQPFKERLVWPVPQVPIPKGSFTPWLGEQAAAMAELFNEQLRNMHVDEQQTLYRQYMHMADLAAKEISWELDPVRNPDSSWGRVYAAIKSDRDKIADRAAPAKLRAEEETRKLWNERLELYVADAIARARQEFDHRHGAHIEADVRKAGEQVIAELEALNTANLIELNDNRRVSARLRMDEKISEILRALEEKAAEQRANENAAFEAATAAVTEYIEEHRKDDILQSEVSARKLEADARYEQLVNETSAKIAAARAEADTRIAAMIAEMQQQNDAFARGLELRNRNFDLERSNHEQREQDLQRRLEKLNADRESEQRELLSQANARVEMAERARDEAIADKELLRERDARMTTAAVVLIVLGAIVLVSLGILAGAFLI